MPFKRILVIMNPVSGRQDPDTVTELIGAQAGAEVVIRGIHSLTDGQPVGRRVAP